MVHDFLSHFIVGLLGLLPLLGVVEFLQQLLDFGKLLLGLCNDDFEVLEADLYVGLVASARLVLVCAVVLNLFAAVLDLCHAECCTAALEEMAEGAELSEILLLPVTMAWVSVSSLLFTISLFKSGQGEEQTHMYSSILSNVLSACWKKSKTMLLLNSLSSSSSSISRICSKVALSMWSPKSTSSPYNPVY
jgi:hypothetical protein